MIRNEILSRVLTAVYSGLKLVSVDLTVGKCIRFVFNDDFITDINKKNGKLDIIFENYSWVIKKDQETISSNQEKEEIKEKISAFKNRALYLNRIDISESGHLSLFNEDGSEFHCKVESNSNEYAVIWFIKIEQKLDIFCLPDGNITLE